MPVKAIPEGFHTLTPLMSVKGAERMIEFLKAGFGGVELDKMLTDDGAVMHASIRIGDSVLMLGEAMEGCSPAVPTSLYIYVPDVDETYRAAVSAGGQSMEGPADQFWGDRAAVVKDFAGNTWWIATHVEDVAEDEMKKRAAAFHEKMAREKSAHAAAA
ncbi:MAG: VOC family protein [Desulfobacteraceae bacterium]|nr:VOC family protein [Desulfobacteraceae bacterium]